MSKPFLTYDEQVEKLEKEKNLIIQNKPYAIDELKQIGYFALIGGYKELLKNPTTKKYKDGTTFEDIVELYKFDENLRELFLKYILKIHIHIFGARFKSLELNAARFRCCLSLSTEAEATRKTYGSGSYDFVRGKLGLSDFAE